MRYLITFVLLSLLSGCNPEKKSRSKIESLQKAGQNEKYAVGMACMEYISRYGDDLPYARSLVKKLLEIGFSAEALYAADLLLQKFPGDAELLYLRGLGYQGQHQYSRAMQDVEKALTLQPQNGNYSAAASKLQDELRLWNEIQALNRSLPTASDSFGILFTRAERYFAMQEYDAALFDLGTISKMRSPEDSVYFTQQVAALYQQSRGPVKILSEMVDYFRARNTTK